MPPVSGLFEPTLVRPEVGATEPEHARGKHCLVVGTERIAPLLRRGLFGVSCG